MKTDWLPVVKGDQMKLERRLLPTLFITLLSVWPAGMQSAEPQRFDVVVYGGTSAGVAAAVQVARMKKTVVLIEPAQYLGGLTTSGLGWTDSGNKKVIGGIAREFYQRVKRHYDDPESWIYEKSQQYDRYRPKDDAMWTFEPHVAQRIMNDFVKEAGFKVVLGKRLDRGQGGVRVEDGRIDSIRIEGGATYRGRMFIDATYEGDLMAAAGVSYAIGRESNDKYGEMLNGVAKKENTHSHRFLVDVDPYVVPGDPKSGLLPGVQCERPGAEGGGDHRVQAYCFRMCMSNVPENRVPFPKPENYDERRYELLLRNFEAGDLRVPMHPGMLPNGKTDTNNNCAFSTDNLGMNYDYPDASYARRGEILREHETYQKGLMWTLANHPRVPESVRKQMSVWGLAKDEFTDNGNWPHQIYVREARRMVGDFVMTEADCRRTRVVKDSIGMGSYNMDSHNTQRYVTREGFVQNEGDVQVSPGGPYMISYRSIVPRRNEAKNLLVPVCLSSSHIAYGSIRMEPVFMILGQSAATAACQAIEAKAAVQDVNYNKLRERLEADKQVLTFSGPYPRRIPYVDPAKVPGIVVDNTQAKLTGQWMSSRSTPGFVGRDYIHNGNSAQGTESKARVEFFPDIPKAGKYEVRISWVPHANRATKVTIGIHHAKGHELAEINQRKIAGKDGFHSLGIWEFAAGKNDKQYVVILTTRTTGYVIADAVQFLPVK